MPHATSRPSQVCYCPFRPSHPPPHSFIAHLAPSNTNNHKIQNRRQNADGLGPPSKRGHSLRPPLALAPLTRTERRRRRQPIGHHQRPPATDSLRDLVPTRAKLGLRARHDDQGPPRRRRPRLARPHRLAHRPFPRQHRRSMAPPTRHRIRRPARNRRWRLRLPGFRSLAADQSRHVRNVPPPPSLPQ